MSKISKVENSAVNPNQNLDDMIFLDFPSSEDVQRKDTAYLTLLGAVNEEFCKSVNDLEKFDPSLRIRKAGKKSRKRPKVAIDLDLNC